MCSPTPGVQGGAVFNAATKCCTYFPKLPNYLVGALLADPNPALAEGQRRVRARIASRVGVLPQHLKPPATWELLYEHGKRGFGKAEALRCPYYDDGACTVWAHREAVCSTWFCKHVAGADGRRMWMTVKTYLLHVELQLSRYALLQHLPEAVLAGDPQAAPLQPEELDELPPRDYARVWGAYAGREEELYRASFETVRALDAAGLQRLLGLDGEILERRVAAARQIALGGELPPRLRLSPDATVQWLPDGSVGLASYSEYDPIALPGAAYPLLAAFDGRATVAEVRARLRDEQQSDLDDNVLLTLYRQRVLDVPP